jgi:hypothetical protein
VGPLEATKYVGAASLDLQDDHCQEGEGLLEESELGLRVVEADETDPKDHEGLRDMPCRSIRSRTQAEIVQSKNLSFPEAGNI